MNFRGIEKFLAYVFVGLGILVTIPALFSYLFAASPLWAVGIAALCGALAGRLVSPVKWPVCLGSAAIAAALTFGYVVPNFGGGITGWSLGLIGATAAAIATAFVLVMLLPNGRNTPPTPSNGRNET